MTNDVVEAVNSCIYGRMIVKRGQVYFVQDAKKFGMIFSAKVITFLKDGEERGRVSGKKPE